MLFDDRSRSKKSPYGSLVSEPLLRLDLIWGPEYVSMHVPEPGMTNLLATVTTSALAGISADEDNAVSSPRGASCRILPVRFSFSALGHASSRGLAGTDVATPGRSWAFSERCIPNFSETDACKSHYGLVSGEVPGADVDYCCLGKSKRTGCRRSRQRWG